MRITLKQLQYFAAAGECSSIKLAAERISISQPSISAAITHLENELGLQLFVRHHAQGIALTTAGRRVMQESKRLLKQTRSLYSIASELKEEIAGQLSVGCMVTLAPIVAPALVQDFTSANPAAQLSLVEDSHDALLMRLRRVEIDVALSYDLAISDDLNFEPLADLPPHVLLSKNHPLADQQSVSIQSLTKYPMILLDLPQSREYFMSLFHSKGQQPQVAMRATSPEVVRTMVANGYGFTITNVRPKNIAALDGRQLVRVKLSGRHQSMKIGIATLANNDKLRLLLEFENHCRAQINNHSIPGMQPL